MSGPANDAWYDDDAGPVVRPFARKRRRPPPAGLDVAELLVATPEAAATELADERAEAVRRCASPTSVAEVAAHLGLPVGEARQLLADLVAAGALARCGSPDPESVLSVLDGLRGL